MRSSVLAIISVIILLSSCYPEYKLAKAYINSKHDVSLMVLPTNYLFKTNLNTDDPGDTTGLSDWEIDSILIAGSRFLKDISDSVFLEIFINSMIIEFEKLGYNVYTENAIDSFLFYQTPAYIFNIAQLELEEHSIEFEDSELIEGTEYFKKLNLDAVTFNCWFEFSELNEEEEGRRLFFADETIADIVDGYFGNNLFTGDIKYHYRIIEMDEDIIYRYCELLAQRYAGYIFDYLMNQYIEQNFPANKKLRFYMHYNRAYNTLDPTEEDKFILMEE